MILKKRRLDGKALVFRHPEPSDARDLVDLVNSLVQEGADIARTAKVTLREERLRLKGMLESMRKKESVMVVAELDGVCVGTCQLSRDTYDVSRHVGTLSIGIKRHARGLGIGKQLVRCCLAESGSMGLRLVKLYVFDTNSAARRFYERLGFVEVGRIPGGVFHNNRYKDDILMAKKLAG